MKLDPVATVDLTVALKRNVNDSPTARVRSAAFAPLKIESVLQCVPRAGTSRTDIIDDAHGFLNRDRFIGQRMFGADGINNRSGNTAGITRIDRRPVAKSTGLVERLHIVTCRRSNNRIPVRIIERNEILKGHYGIVRSGATGHRRKTHSQVVIGQIGRASYRRRSDDDSASRRRNDAEKSYIVGQQVGYIEIRQCLTVGDIDINGIAAPEVWTSGSFIFWTNIRLGESQQGWRRRCTRTPRATIDRAITHSGWI